MFKASLDLRLCLPVCPSTSVFYCCTFCVSTATRIYEYLFKWETVWFTEVEWLSVLSKFSCVGGMIYLPSWFKITRMHPQFKSIMHLQVWIFKIWMYHKVFCLCYRIHHIAADNRLNSNQFSLDCCSVLVVTVWIK